MLELKLNEAFSNFEGRLLEKIKDMDKIKDIKELDKPIAKEIGFKENSQEAADISPLPKELAPNTVYEVNGDYFATDDFGQIYKTNGELEKNNEYTLNGIKYSTDSEGKVVSWEGELGYSPKAEDYRDITELSETNDEVIKKLSPYSETKDGTNYYYDDNGKVYRIGNDLAPNANYELNGYKYSTDEQSRIVSAEGQLHVKNRIGRMPIRDSIEDIGKGDQLIGDDRGHLIGDQFDGSNGLENMVPQDAHINRNDFMYFENGLADAVREGKEVYNKIEPIYEGDSRRPVAIMSTYTIDGGTSIRIFPNEKEAA